MLNPSDKCISSPELAYGAPLPVSSVSPTTDLFGQPLAPVRPSPAPGQTFDVLSATRAALCRTLSELERSIASDAGTSGRPTSATCSPSFSGSSASAALNELLESRLRAQTDGLGSTLYRLRWKCWVTPLGRRIPALRASARPISDSACIGWPTPTVGNANGSQMAKEASATGRRPDGTKATVSLNQVATLAGWATPSSRDWKDTGDLETSRFRKDGKERKDTVPRQANLAGWPTPMASSPAKLGRYNQAGNNDSHRATEAMCKPITEPARLTGSGLLVTGYHAQMENGGQLSPRHSLWLMLGSLADCWLTAAERVDRSTIRSQKRAHSKTESKNSEALETR